MIPNSMTNSGIENGKFNTAHDRDDRVTACVWLAMYIIRLRYISKNNITPELIDTPEKLIQNFQITSIYPLTI